MEQNHQMMKTLPKRWLSATPLALQPPPGHLKILENFPKFFGAGSDSAEDYKTFKISALIILSRMRRVRLKVKTFDGLALS